MDSGGYWQMFMKTGDITAYLYYRAQSSEHEGAENYGSGKSKGDCCQRSQGGGLR